MKNIKDVKDYLMELDLSKNDVKTYNLDCKYDNAKSFYGKAKIKEVNNLKVLYSYNTLVCAIYENCYGKKYMLNWNIQEELLFSNTTLRHIKEFLKQYYNNKEYTKKDIIHLEGIKEV